MIDMASSRATVYCEYRGGYYWYAQATLDGVGLVDSKKRHHGSARQAADEVLAQIRATGAEATMRRIGQKQYEIVAVRKVRTCRVCGCTDLDCSGCIERTGAPCWWVDDDLCSACGGHL
jgi:hypothetical protein